MSRNASSAHSERRPEAMVAEDSPLVTHLGRLLLHLARVRAAERAANDTRPPAAVASEDRP